MSESTSARYLSDEAVDLAVDLLRAARSAETSEERAENRRLADMVDDEAGKDFTLDLADQVLRIRRPGNAARVFRGLVERYGVPSYLSPFEHGALRLGTATSRFLPWLVMPAVCEMVRQQSGKVILNGAHLLLQRHIDTRRQAGHHLNINQLGEAVLGEREAANRLGQTLDLLANPDVDYISVKISNLYSQINVVAFEHTLERVCECLRQLYRAAVKQVRTDSQGRRHATFVNLDMEEYRDVELTRQAFQRVLSEPEFRHLEAGIVLQAYLPDSFPLQRELTNWARRRVEKGGAPIKIRLVKGANLAMETVDAEIHDWAPTPYASKQEVDANFKRMVQYGCRLENARAVRLGIASHNLFDIAWAMLLREREGVEDFVEFEMLEGMADHQARVVGARSGGMLFYAPVVEREHFPDAMAYLVRRLDENTHPQNFLRHSFSLQPGSRAWRQQEEMFRNALRERNAVTEGSRRRQNRARERRLFDLSEPFRNEPDTDFVLPANRAWLEASLEAWNADPVTEIPLVIAGEEVESDDLARGIDPGEADAPRHRPHPPLYRYFRAGNNQVERALEAAESARPGWERLGLARRREILARAAELFAANRGRLIAAMQRDGGKGVVEADAEVSEAIDFANFYARSLDNLPPGLEVRPRGTISVVPPWNFPFAIPVGGCMAALVGGNTVILKPAPETVLSAWLGARLLWEAGVPRDVLQFVPTPENETGRKLLTDSRVAEMIFTGSSDTAKLFQKWKPDLNIHGETSGKNMLVITDAADTDLAIRDLVRSAFGHAGQKCSAASVALVTAPVHDDPGFFAQLADATESLLVGPATELEHSVNTLIRSPEGPLKRILVDNELEPGQRWLVRPRRLRGNPRLWSPGVLVGVRPHHWIARTELFGPVLSVLRMADLDEAIAFQNSSAFGLTGGIHSLDETEISRWRERIEVGNLYINRPITGAIVNRQPFGGWKHSCIGPGAKAGGRNYVAQFVEIHETDLPTEKHPLDTAITQLVDDLARVLSPRHEVEAIAAAARSYAWWQAREFAVEHDPSGLDCESNVFRYIPRHQAAYRIVGDLDEDPARTLAVARFALACATAGVALEISSPRGDRLLDTLASFAGITVVIEDEASLAERISCGVLWTILRAIEPVGLDLHRALDAANIPPLADPVLASGRFELLCLHREQSVTETMHRYGNPLKRGHA